MADLRLIVGLGNPGPQYAETRHNIGFMVLDRLAQVHALTFSAANAWKGVWAKWAGCFLLKPLTYMNLSGESVGPFAHYYKVMPEEMLVVVDDVALPLGRLRLRGSGSDGGHNGLRSLIEHLGENFMRLRIGIGAGEGLVDHVLSKFDPAEREKADQAVERAVAAIEQVRREGLESAMNLYNRAE
jgi:PTH1 family peptidyl-tRNA hydrolase